MHKSIILRGQVDGAKNRAYSDLSIREINNIDPTCKGAAGPAGEMAEEDSMGNDLLPATAEGRLLFQGALPERPAIYIKAAKRKRKAACRLAADGRALPGGEVSELLEESSVPSSYEPLALLLLGPCPISGRCPTLWLRLLLWT
jgi:hypothetical protein